MAILAVVLLATDVVHLGYIEDDKANTGNLIQEFHKKVNSDNFEQIYTSASNELRVNQSETDFVGVLRSVVNSAGKFRQVNSCDLTVIVDASRPFVRAICDEEYERAPVTEFFTFVRSGHSLRLASYRGAVGWYAMHSAEIAAAKSAAMLFYKQLTERQFASIWNAVDPDFRAATNEASFLSLLSEVRNRWGSCDLPGLIDIDYVENDNGHLVGLVYARHCSHGPLQERLAWRIVNGRALLRGYHVN